MFQSQNNSILACPNCGKPLDLTNQSYQCENRHHFDIAKQGYVNLLIANQKNSLSPGDTKDMVKSRWDFLNKGYYLPIAEAIKEAIQEDISLIQSCHTAKSATSTTSLLTSSILDVGCGVGYYLNHLKDNFKKIESNSNITLKPYGLDISKEAIKLAAKYHDIKWLVSSSKQLPFLDHSLDLILSVFSPVYMDEIVRCITPKGLLMMVTPASEHLIELRQVLFDNVEPIESDKILDKTNTDFSLIKSIPIQFKINIKDKEDIRNLLTMTPFYWKSSHEKQELLLKYEQLEISIDLKLWILQSNTSSINVFTTDTTHSS